jgi:MoxR-like ATPase
LTERPSPLNSTFNPTLGVFMRPKEVTIALHSLLPTRRPIYLWGPPGVGKSSLIRQAAEAEGLQVCDLRAVLLDPVDLRGLPSINGDQRAHWCPPAFLPHGTDTNGVLFLDELAQAPPLVQAACLQLTLDRRVGEYVLPDGWTVVAASNRAEDRAGAHRLISPLLNRFVHLDLDASHDDWQAWALTFGIRPEVCAFLRFRPELLFQFDASRNQRAFPTPRSWQFVSEVVAATPAELLHAVAAGCVGEGPAAEFCAFVHVFQQLPNVDEVLANPAGCNVPTDPAVLYALSGAIVQRCRGADDTTLGAAVTYAGRMPAEFGVLTVRDVASVNPKVLNVPQCGEWLRNHRDLFLSGRA